MLQSPLFRNMVEAGKGKRCESVWSISTINWMLLEIKEVEKRREKGDKTSEERG